MRLTFNLNGRNISRNIDPLRRLVDFLREDIGLTGTKYGCGAGECGACNVIIDGRVVNSCLILMGRVNKAKILTIEGISKKKLTKKTGDSFLKNGAVQCGYCTPGMVISTYALLTQNKKPKKEEIERAIAGNLCRCTGYTKIFKAISSIGRNQ